MLGTDNPDAGGERGSFAEDWKVFWPPGPAPTPAGEHVGSIYGASTVFLEPQAVCCGDVLQMQNPAPH